MIKSTKTANIFLKNYLKETKEKYYRSLLKDYQNDMKRKFNSK